MQQLARLLRTRAARAVCVTALVCVTSLSLVVSAQGPAAALDPGGYAKIGTTLAAPSTVVEGVEVAGAAGRTAGLCATGVGCAVGIGLLLYSTHDLWMPLVKDIFSGDDGWNNGGEANAGVVTPYSVAGSIDGGDVIFTVSSPATRVSIGTTLWTPDGLNRGWHVECRNKSTGSVAEKYLQSPPNAVWYGDPATSLPAQSVRVCDPGFETVDLVEATFRDRGVTGCGNCVTVTVGAPIPPKKVAYKSKTTCERPDGSKIEIESDAVGPDDSVTGSGEDPKTAKVAIKSCFEADPTSVPRRVEVSGGRAGSEMPLWSADLTDTRTQYPDCFDADGHFLTSTCVVRVWVNGLPCTRDRAICASWDTAAQDEGAQVQCKFGPYALPIAECKLLKEQYRPDAETKTVSNPKTGVWTGAEPDYDPATGEPIPGTGSMPAEDTDTGEDSDPLPSTGTNPKTGDGDNCMDDAWGWNPLNWVFTPVKCALSWAFVPSTSLDTRLSAMRDQVQGKAPFSWLDGIAGIPGAVPSTGCPNWRVKVGPVDSTVICDSSFTGAIRGMRPIFLAFMGALAVWPLIRSTAYAGVPVVKPQPGSV